MYRNTFQGRGGFEIFNRPTPRVIKILLYVNIGVYLGEFLLRTLGIHVLHDWFALFPEKAVSDFMVWQYLTYAYLHSPSPLHILLNMLILWMFGCELAGYFGTRRFLVLYHVAAFTGGVAQVVAQYVKHATMGSTVGASGAIMGLLAVYALLFPNRQILFFLIVPMKMKYFILIIIAVDFISGTNFLSTGTAHFCHLGGILAGFLYLFFSGRFGEFFLRLEERMRARDAEKEQTVRNTVDALLEKIRHEGIHTLSAREKRFLNNASKLYKKEDHLP